MLKSKKYVSTLFIFSKHSTINVLNSHKNYALFQNINYFHTKYASLLKKKSIGNTEHRAKYIPLPEFEV